MRVVSESPWCVVRVVSKSPGLGSLSQLDRFEEAEHYLVPAYEGALESLGPDHRYTKIIRSYVFKFYTRWKKSDIAELYAP